MLRTTPGRVVLLLMLLLCLPPSALARREGVDVLVQRLKSREYKVRLRALEDLRWWGVAAAKAVPDLIRALKDSSLGVRLAAVRVLAVAGPGAAQAVPALVDLVREEKQGSSDWADFGLADEAITALGGMGEGARAAVPLLIETLDSRQAGVWQSGVTALGTLGPVASDAAPRLARLLGGPDHRVLVAWAAWRTGAPPATFLPILRQGMQAPDDDDRLLAMALVGVMGPAASPLRREVTASLKDPYPRARLFAARALLRQGGDIRACVPVLASGLDPRYFGAPNSSPTDMGFWDAERAAELLAGAGSEARLLVPSLGAALEASDARQVSPACTLLASLPPEQQPPALLPSLVRLVALRERGSVAVSIRCRAARQLGSMGPRATSALPTLLDCMRSDAPGIVRASAAAAILGIEPTHHEARQALSPLGPDLGRLLFKPQEGAYDAYDVTEERLTEARIFWLDTLGRLGPLVADALPFVQAAQRLPDERVREAAASAEKAIAPGSRGGP